MRNAEIYFKDHLAGILTETESGYEFRYNKEYLDNKGSDPVSLTLPLSEKPYQSKILFEVIQISLLGFTFAEHEEDPLHCP